MIFFYYIHFFVPGTSVPIEGAKEVEHRHTYDLRQHKQYNDPLLDTGVDAISVDLLFRHKKHRKLFPSGTFDGEVNDYVFNYFKNLERKKKLEGI